MPPPQVNILPIPKLRALIVLRATLVHVVHLFLFRQPLSFYDFIDSRRLGRRGRSPSPTVFRTSWVLALARGIDDTKRTYKLLEIYSAMIFGAIQVCGLSRTSVHTNPFLWTLGVGTTIIVVAAVGLSAVIILTVSRWKRSLLLVDTTNQRTPQRNIEEVLEQSPETTAWNIWVALSLPIALTIWASLLFILFLITLSSYPPSQNDQSKETTRSLLGPEVVVVATLCIVMALVVAAVVRIYKFKVILHGYFEKVAASLV